MNANDLLATGPAVTGPHQSVHAPAIILVLVVLAALGWGAVRLTHRHRLNRPPRPVTKPEPPAPRPEPTPPPRAPAPSASLDRPNGGWAVETHGLNKRFGAT